MPRWRKMLVLAINTSKSPHLRTSIACRKRGATGSCQRFGHDCTQTLYVPDRFLCVERSMLPRRFLSFETVLTSWIHKQIPTRNNSCTVPGVAFDRPHITALHNLCKAVVSLETHQESRQLDRFLRYFSGTMGTSLDQSCWLEFLLRRSDPGRFADDASYHRS